MTRRIFWMTAVLTALATSVACGDDEPAGGASCPPDNPECKEIANAEDGKLAVQRRKCVDCHGANMAGQTSPLVGFPKAPSGEDVELYPPNLTNDKETGIGDWSDDALALAIRSGIDLDSEHLCPQMVHFSSMKDYEVYSIVKYLRTLPPVKQKVPRSVCPPLKTKEQQTLGD